MSDFPRSRRNVTPLMVHSYSRYGIGAAHHNIGGAGLGSTTWVANLIAYVPFSLPFGCPVNRVFWTNGLTVTTTNVDFGIYTAGGARIYSTGATAMVGALANQYVTPSTKFILAPDRYYFAWTCTSTTSRAYTGSLTTATKGRLTGLLQEAGSGTLPATMTPASWAQTFGAPLCGVTRTINGF